MAKSKDYIGERVRMLFEDKSFRRLPAVLVTGQPTIFYLTNFTGHDSWALVTPERVFLLTDGRYTLQAQQECPHAKAVIRKGPMVPVLAKVLQRQKIRRVGLFSQEFTLAMYEHLQRGCPKTRWKLMSSEAIERMREIKSEAEISKIRQAVTAAELAFEEFIADLKPGRTENELAGDLEYRMRCHGAERASFDTIVACGENAAKPHAPVSTRKICVGRPIVIDFGAKVNGYCSDLTRTVCLGKMPRYFKEIYQVCLEAQKSAIEAVKPGERTDRIDRTARRIISRAGYGANFNHGLGHGLGLMVHERPGLSRRTKQSLEPGMVLTIEPGIYLPGKGGVRIEDDVLVTQTGCEVLSSLPKELDQMLL